MQAKLKHVSLSFPLDLQMDSVLLTRPNDTIAHQTDTVADVQRLVVKVQLMPLFDGKVEVDELTFNKLKANTTNFIGDLRIRGNLDRLHLISHNIDINGDSMKIDQADSWGLGRCGFGRHGARGYHEEEIALAHQDRQAKP